MKNFQAALITKVIEVDGVMMTVPLNTRHIAIDKMGYVWAWKIKPSYNELFDEFVCTGTYSPTFLGIFEDFKGKPEIITLPACA
ncbi:hypothetical protein [Escherichia phage 4E8]|nr:hypothetical protein [Escherichia phage 4E8]